MPVFDVDELLAASRERSGLSDFGPPDFMEGLTVLVDGLNRSSPVREDRRDALKERLLNLLVNRQRLAHDIAEHPEILDEVIDAPAIIVSLPRTGSTKLQRILGATDDFQVLRFWSVLRYGRIPGMADGGIGERIRQTREFEKWVYAVSPETAKWHPVFTDEPEEDCFVMEGSFREPMNWGMTGASGFLEWLETADKAPTYDYLRSVAQYLQWQFPSERHKPWLFKNPSHLGAEARLTQLYRNPRFIVTHRDPAKCMPSIGHTMNAVRQLYTGGDTSRQVAAGAMQWSMAEATRHIAWRDANPDIPVLDLSFREVTTGGIRTVEKVYDFLGMELTDAAIAKAEAWEARNPREKHGTTSYSADEFGSSEAEIRARFAPYIERFSAYMD